MAKISGLKQVEDAQNVRDALVKAWDEWVKEVDGGQEKAARILDKPVGAALIHGWRLDEMWEVLKDQRKEASAEGFADMMAFLDDWQGAGLEP
jgi:hypothetical protein